MPRNPRWNIADVPQLVEIAGHNGSALFKQDRDYAFFLGIMAEAAVDCACTIHTFALTPERVGILCTPRRPGAVGAFMQALGRAYAPRFNRWYGRSGSLWNGRYRAALVEPAAPVLDAQRYVDTLFTRGTDAAPGAPHTPWTGLHRRHLPSVRHLIRHHPAYLALGHDAPTREARYRRLCAQPLPRELTRHIAQAVAQGFVIGSDAFRQRLAQTLGRRTAPGRPGRPKSRTARGGSEARRQSATCLSTP